MAFKNQKFLFWEPSVTKNTLIHISSLVDDTVIDQTAYMDAW
jgi:hypothetical protein